MAIQFLDGQILFVDGAIAMDPACCCDGGAAACQRCTSGYAPNQVTLTASGFVSPLDWLNDPWVCDRSYDESYEETVFGTYDCWWRHVFESPVSCTIGEVIGTLDSIVCALRLVGSFTQIWAALEFTFDSVKGYGLVGFTSTGSSVTVDCGSFDDFCDLTVGESLCGDVWQDGGVEGVGVDYRMQM